MKDEPRPEDLMQKINQDAENVNNESLPQDLIDQLHDQDKISPNML